MLFKNRSPPRPWVCVRPVGTRSNRDAIGALIKIRQGDKVIRRDVSASSGAQDHSGANCAGLPTGRPVEVMVCWPRAGQESCQRFRELVVNRTHMLIESS